jgi:hypothetical protein
MRLKRSFLAACIGALLFLQTGNVWGQSERKTAKAFLAQAQNGIPVQVNPPSFLYKYNLKTGILDTIWFTTARQKDSILWVHSDYIRKINDSLFLSRFMKGYLSELRKYGFRPQDTLGLNNGYHVDVAQIELDEQYYHFADTAFYDNDVYVYRQKLNALDVNIWFLIRGPLVKNPKGKLLFVENLLTDHLEGHFDLDPYTGDIRYLYNLDSLTVQKIYNYAQNLGRTYAGYTFDYLLNAYLKEKLPPDKRSGHYWRYDPYRKKFFIAYDDRFVPLDDRSK